MYVEPSRTSNDGDARSRVSESQEAYKRALVEVLAVVLHPPEFALRTGRYAWCIQVNKLLCNLKSITKRIPPEDVPPSFEDVDAFIADAWKFGFTEDVPNFYLKWPSDLDRRVEESFENGASLGKMVLSVVFPDSTETSATATVSKLSGLTSSSAGSKVTVRSEERSRRRRSAVGLAAAQRNTSSPTSATTTSSTSSVVTPFTPRSTTSLGLRVLTSTQSSSSLDAPRSSSSLSPSLRRFNMADFEGISRKKDGERNAGASNRNGALRQRTISTASVSSLSSIRNTQSPTPTPLVPGPSSSAPPPPQSLSPERERQSEIAELEAPERSISLATNLGHSASERPWIPPSYRDGSMPADVVEMFKDLDDVCQVTEGLITEAEDIDAPDPDEKRLKDWTTRAKECQINGRKALARINKARRSKYDHVLYVASTLQLLKSAHVELIEYADFMLNSSGSSHPDAPGIDASTSAGLEPTTQHSGPGASTSIMPRKTVNTLESSRETPASSSWLRSAASQNKLIPCILVPSVPWKWRRETPPIDVSSSEDDIQGEDKPDKFITTSITIPRQAPPLGSGSSASAVASGSGVCSGEGGGTNRIVRLQRTPDRQAGDIEHAPACSECAQRGLNCFGKLGQPGACRRCKRVKKGHCTYARPRAGLTTSSSSAKVTFFSSKWPGPSKGKGKGVEKDVVGPIQNRKRNRGAIDESILDKAKKQSMPRRSLDALRKLHNARARMEEMQVDEDGDGGGDEGDEDNNDDYEDDNVSVDGRRPLKRRRSASPQDTHERGSGFGLDSVQTDSLVRATSEPPDRALHSNSGASIRPTFMSLARSSSSSGNAGPSVALSSPWTLRWRNEAAEARDRVAYVPPASAPSSDAYRDSHTEGTPEVARRSTRVHMTSEPAPSLTPETDGNPTPTPQPFLPPSMRASSSPQRTFVTPTPPSAVSGALIEQSAVTFVSAPASTVSLATSAANLDTLATVSATLPAIPTPNSLSSSSPADFPIPLPRVTPTHDRALVLSSTSTSAQPQPSGSDQNDIVSLAAMVNALTEELREVREELRVLKSG